MAVAGSGPYGGWGQAWGTLFAWHGAALFRNAWGRRMILKRSWAAQHYCPCPQLFGCSVFGLTLAALPSQRAQPSTVQAVQAPLTRPMPSAQPRHTEGA